MSQSSENAKFNWQQQLRENPNFCILPFIHAHVGTTGEASLCCVAERPPKEWGDGSLSLTEIWTSDYYQEVRKQMLAGERVSHCRRCWEADDRGGGSDRQIHNTWFKAPSGFDLDIEKGNSLGAPSFLDLRPGNFCNLACRMCFTRVSSGVNDLHRDHPELEEVTGESYWHEVNDWIDDPVRFEEVKSWIPNTKTLKLAGGEPLFMPGVIKLLRWCVDSGNTHLHLDITTNGTRTQGKVLNWLEKFDSVDIQLSIDGVGKVNDYIRSGSNWHEIDKAYQKYLDMNVRVNLLVAVQNYNIFSLVDLIEYWKDHGANGNFVFNFVDWPRELQIDILPESIRLRVANQIEEAFELFDKNDQVRLRVTALLDRLRNPNIPDDVDQLRKQWCLRTAMFNRINVDQLPDARLVELYHLWARI